MSKRLTDSSITNINTGLGNETLDNPHYDSQLIVSTRNGTTNCDLIITLKIHFVQVSTATGPTFADTDKVAWPVRDWMPADDFSEWCKKACDHATTAWNGKLWLKTPDAFDGLDWPNEKSSYRPNVYCGFKCKTATGPSDAHFQVKVAKIDETKPLPGVDFHSDFQLWDNKDIDEWGFNSKAGPQKQRTVCHEVGHILGLHHIGEVARVTGCFMGAKMPWAGGNAMYGSDDANPDLAGNIMGLGMKVTSHNALPWQKEMCKHANKIRTFKLDPGDWEASGTRIAPRLLSEVSWKLLDF